MADITITIPSITNIPNYNTDTQEQFTENALLSLQQQQTFSAALNTFATQANALATQANSNENGAAASALEASGYANTAVDARDAAIASAVYKGAWEGKTSAGVIGESYSYQGSYIYRLNVSLANISTSVPSPTNTDWQLINVVPFEAPIKSTLDLDFANQDFTVYSKTEGFVKKPLTDIVSQGRATAGSSVDAIGGVTEFSAGANRFTFDGETGEALGYLSEESRTNLLTNSEFPNGLSDAPNRGGLVTLDSMDLGNGAVNAIAFGYDGSTTSFAIKTNFTPVIGETYVLSVIVEMDDGLPPSFESSNFNSIQNDFVMYLAGNPSGADPLTYTVSRMYNNTYKVSAVKTTSLDIAAFGVYRYSTNSPRTFKVTGFQVEVGSFLTSYIKTLGTAVTRAADAMTRTLGQEWNPNEGTFVVEFDISNYTSGQTSILRSVNSAVHLWCYVTRLDGVTAYDGSQAVGAVGIEGTFRRAAISSTKNNMSMSVNGSDTSTAITNGNLLSMTGFNVGILNFNNAIRSITYYPRAFDSATLQRLSRI
jgi:hypothetical protein